jgi:hypothetical protein
MADVRVVFGDDDTPNPIAISCHGIVLVWAAAEAWHIVQVTTREIVPMSFIVVLHIVSGGGFACSSPS